MTSTLSLDDLLSSWLEIESSGFPLELYLLCRRNDLSHHEAVWAWTNLPVNLVGHYARARRADLTQSQARAFFTELSATDEQATYNIAMDIGVTHAEYKRMRPQTPGQRVEFTQYLECRDAGVTHAEYVQVYDSGLPLDEYYGARTAGLDHEQLLEAAAETRVTNRETWFEKWAEYVFARLDGSSHQAALAAASNNRFRLPA